jgi:hypothetical protein
MATRPPVTQQQDWETTLQPWMEDVAAQLEVSGVDLDAFLVGAAVARGARLEEACAAVEALTRAGTSRERAPGHH